MAPVVIPALTPTLDKSPKADRLLCPVRALCYYLGRISDFRQDKELVLVSFKNGDFAASKAFPSGVSLEQLLSGCHWKFSNTFTEFYLNDDSEFFHLGSGGGCSADPPLAHT